MFVIQIFVLYLHKNFDMDVIKLRILTEKSLIGFGKYNGCTVRQIIDLGKQHYLKWIYFNMYGISFTEDLLNKIHLDRDYRFIKPGAYPDLWKEYNQILSSIPTLQHGIDNHNKKRKSTIRRRKLPK